MLCELNYRGGRETRLLIANAFNAFGNGKGFIGRIPNPGRRASLSALRIPMPTGVSYPVEEASAAFSRSFPHARPQNAGRVRGDGGTGFPAPARSARSPIQIRMRNRPAVPE